MKLLLARKDLIQTGLLIFPLFVLLPTCLWCVSRLRSYQVKKTIQEMVPAIIQDVEPAMQRAMSVLAQEIIPSTDYYANQERTQSARSAIYTMCQAISDSILIHQPGFTTDPYFCSLYIKAGDRYITANRHNAYLTTYEYDLADLKDLEATSDRWRLYPNNRDWRVKYKIQTDPMIVIDFAVVSQDRDY